MRRNPSTTRVDFYGQTAEAYSKLWAPVLLSATLALFKALPFSGARRILDVGSGVGSSLPHIRKASPEALVVAVDYSEKMLRLSPSGFAPAVMDASRLAFGPGCFDMGIMAFVLFYLRNPLDGLLEVCRVLRRGAPAGTTTWGPDPGYPAQDIWDEELDRAGAIDPAGGGFTSHGLVDTPGKVSDLLNQSGFREIRTWTRSFVYQSAPQEFISRQIRVGSRSRRLNCLGRKERDSFLQTVRERLSGLRAEDFTMNRNVVFGTGRAR